MCSASHTKQKIKDTIDGKHILKTKTEGRLKVLCGFVKITAGSPKD